MRVRSIAQNSKFRNISEGTEYEVLREDGNYYFVLNDSGGEHRYGKANFEEVVVHIPLEYTIVVNDGVTVSLKRGEISIDVRLSAQGVAGNCGVDAINGVNILFASISRVLRESPETSPAESSEEIFSDIIESIIDEFETAYVCFSTNVEYPEILRALDAITEGSANSVSTPEVINPNSGTGIRTWMIATGVLPSEDDDDDNED